MFKERFINNFSHCMCMEEKVRVDVLAVLDYLGRGISKGDLELLKNSSDKTLHNASLYQDEDSITIAVIAYSLYKVFSRERLHGKKSFGTFRNKVLNELTGAKDFLKRGDLKNYSKLVKKVLALIGKLERKFGMYITEVLQQAKIKKGGRVFEHGISAGRASQMMGINTWELRSYIGHTKLTDVTKPKDVSVRIENVRRIFGL
jgi:hypothetical protein